MADLQCVRILNIFLMLLIWTPECTSQRGEHFECRAFLCWKNEKATNVTCKCNINRNINIDLQQKDTNQPQSSEPCKPRAEKSCDIYVWVIDSCEVTVTIHICQMTGLDWKSEQSVALPENGVCIPKKDTEENDDDNDSDILGPVIGTVLAALLLLVIFIVIIILQRRKLREAKLRMNNDTSRDNHQGNSDSINVAFTKGSGTSPQPRSIPGSRKHPERPDCELAAEVTDNEYIEIGDIENSGACNNDNGKYNDDSPSNLHKAYEKLDVISHVSLVQNYDRLRVFKKEDNEDISFNAYEHSSTNTQKSYERLKFTKDNDSKSSEGYDRWNASSDDQLNLTKL